MGAHPAPTSESQSASRHPGFDVGSSSGSYELVFSGVIFGLIGLYLDRRIGTTPVFVIVFSILGFTGAVASIYYRYKHQIAQIQAETDALRAAQRGSKHSGARSND